MPTDMLVDELVARAEDWSNYRDYDNGNRERWRGYYRVYRGVWQSEDATRASERSHVIMPSTSQAIDAAVSDVIEALFSKEQWIDTGIPMLDDLLLADLWDDRPNIEESIFLGALYGTLITKIVVENIDGRAVLSTQALHPEEFIIDPSATSIKESFGVGQHLFVPRNVIEKRMRDGVYRDVDLEGSGEFFRVDPGQSQPRNTDYIELLEWHGLVPIEEVEARERTDQLKNSAIGDDNLVEAICTIANKSVVLRCEANPFGEDRPFVAAQWHTVPRQFWGRGVAEAAYWPQKAIDSEMRARIDALAYSTVPMMAVSASQVPRSERFETRPGRSVFVRGDVRTAIAPIQFAGPDPGTYQQTVELQRMIELGTGQATAASPVGDMTRTGSGPLSAVLGASVKRSARTLLNIERDFILPLIQKATLRMNRLRPDIYPPLTRKAKVVSGVGIMLRELENQQLANLMQNVPDPAAQLSLLKMIVEGSALREKQDVISIIDQVIQKAMGPQELSPQDELQMAQMQAQERRDDARVEQDSKRLQLDMAKLRLETQKVESEDRRKLIELGIKGEEIEGNQEAAAIELMLDKERVETDRIQAEAQVIMAQAQPEAEDKPQGNLPENEVATADVIDLDSMREQILKQVMEGLPDKQKPESIKIERDSKGLIKSINGMQVTRNSQGLIEGIG